jgi:hypothetical protein
MQSALHVIGAAAVQSSVLHARLVRVGHAAYGDGVGVGVEQQHRSVTRSALASEHQGTPVERHDIDIEAAVAAPLLDEGGDLGFAGGAWHECGVHGVDRHQRGDEVLRLWAYPRHGSRN